MNILVVDDHALTRKLLRVNLEADGYRVREASDGIEALQLLKQEPANVVVSDVLMPRMDGYRLCHEVRKDPRFSKVPFLIFSSTYVSTTDETLALDLGADRFFRKPEALSELLQAVKDLVQQAPYERAPTMPPDELFVLKEYSEVLVRKLEKRNDELEAAQALLKEANEMLEARVGERTAQLEVANKELAAFGYSISHDLRAPLRQIDCFAGLLSEEYGPQLDATGQEHLHWILDSVRRMHSMIEGLLKLARTTHSELDRHSVDLSALAADVIEKLRAGEAQRQVEVCIAPQLTVQGDAILLRIVLDNLLSNSWKFTGQRPDARIEVGRQEEAGRAVYFVRDNGAGFDMQHAARLFELFQRVHREDEFPGTGIGLVTVKRIVERHGGTIRAEGAPGQGATFSFTL